MKYSTSDSEQSLVAVQEHHTGFCRLLRENGPCLFNNAVEKFCQTFKHEMFTFGNAKHDCKLNVRCCMSVMVKGLKIFVSVVAHTFVI